MLLMWTNSAGCQTPTATGFPCCDRSSPLAAINRLRVTFVPFARSHTDLYIFTQRSASAKCKHFLRSPGRRDTSDETLASLTEGRNSCTLVQPLAKADPSRLSGKWERKHQEHGEDEDVRRSESIICVGQLSAGHIKSPAASWPVVQAAREATGNS